MGRFDSKLEEFERNSKWLKLADGQTVRGKFMNASEVMGSFGGEMLDALIEVNGVGKHFQTSAKSAYRFFNELRGGAEIEIKRTGIEKKTKYEFRNITGEDSPF